MAAARRVLLDDALLALPVLEASTGAVVDVGSGGGSPGIPLAVHCPELPFTLLEAERRKCLFLEQIAANLPNVTVVWGRAEQQQLAMFGVALAKALAKPPVAVELCLPLLVEGGVAVLWVGPSVDMGHVSRAAATLGGEIEREQRSGLLVVRKVRATPPGFPRRPGMAKKRPLA